MIINRVYSRAVLALAYIAGGAVTCIDSCFARFPQLNETQVDRNNSLPDSQYLSENGINFRNPQAYTALMNAKGLPATIIVGSGRMNDNDLIAYENPYNYLLVDLVNSAAADTSSHWREIIGFGDFIFHYGDAKPDVDSDIMKLSADVFGSGQYNYIIFENVPMNSSLTRPAIEDALSLLAPGGVIVSSRFPRIAGIGICIEEFSNFMQLHFGDKYTFFYELGEGGVLENHSDFIIDITDPESAASMSEKEQFELLNSHKETFLEYFGDKAREQIADIAFREIVLGSAFWPSSSEQERNTIGGFAMIITKR